MPRQSDSALAEHKPLGDDLNYTTAEGTRLDREFYLAFIHKTRFSPSNKLESSRRPTFYQIIPQAEMCHSSTFHIFCLSNSFMIQLPRYNPHFLSLIFGN